MNLPSLRRQWVVGASLSLLAILLVGSNYKDWKSARLRKSAATSLEKQRPVEAALDAAAALQIVPGDPELTYILGNAYDSTNDERLLDVLAQQIELEPDSLDPRFRLARAAMRFGRLDISSEVVADMPSSAAATADFHKISSALATISKQGNRLVQHAHELYKLEPEHNEHLLKLAGLSVLAGEFNLSDTELAKLRTLQNDSVDAAVLLWAISQLPDYPENDSTQLQSNLLPALGAAHVPFSTRLQALDLAIATNQKQCASEILTLLKKEATASRSTEEIGVLLAWMNRQGDTENALNWCRELKLFADEKPIARFAVVLADTCARNAAWDELDWIVTGSDWGNGDFIRNFYAAKSAAERPSPTRELKRESFLRLALKDTATNPAQIHLLWKKANKYGWRDLSKQLSWKIVEITRTRPELLAILEKIATDSLLAGDLPEFRKATAALLKTSPGQWELRNNDFYAALLSDGCDDERLEAIKQFHDELQIHPDVKTTYALALHLSGDSKAAAAILSELDESLLNSPSIAPFGALIFAAIGDDASADRYRSLPHRLFFPEEEALLALSQ